MEQVEKASRRKQVGGLGIGLELPASQQPWGRGWSVIQSETADGLSGGKGQHVRGLAFSVTSANKGSWGVWWVTCCRWEAVGTLAVRGGERKQGVGWAAAADSSAGCALGALSELSWGKEGDRSSEMKEIREITLSKDIYGNKILEDISSKMKPRKDKVDETCNTRNSDVQ